MPWSFDSWLLLALPLPAGRVAAYLFVLHLPAVVFEKRMDQSHVLKIVT